MRGLIIAVLLVGVLGVQSAAPWTSNPLIKAILADPRRDILESVSASRLASQFPITDAQVESLKSAPPRANVTVNIVLKFVGFEGEGAANRFSITETEFRKFLRPAMLPFNASTISDTYSEKIKSGKDLPVTVNLNYAFKHASRELAGQLAAARDSAIAAKQFKSNPLSHSIIDGLIQDDAAKEPRERVQYTIYILNLPTTDVRYYYTDATGTKCSTNSWIGEERYIWVDLAAGPIVRGPATVGDGAVTSEHVPFIKNYLNSDGALDKQKAILDIVDFLRKTVQHVLVPSLDHYPLFWWSQSIVKFIIIRDENNLRSRFDVSAIKEELQRIPRLMQQQLEYADLEVKLEYCESCAVALTMATKRHTSSYEHENKLHLRVHPYLDSAELHQWLLDYESRTNQLVNEKPRKHVLPVYLFDLGGSDLLLLDRFHQVVAFPDMIVAVQSDVTRVGMDYRCSGDSIFFDARDARRPILAALLRTVWGVAPTHLVFNAAHQEVETNHIWSVGRTPFGPFSSSLHLSFAQIDAAARGFVVSLMASVIEVVGQVGERLKVEDSTKARLRDQIPESEFEEFGWRLGVLQFELHHADIALQHGQYSDALALVSAADSDALRLHHFINAAQQNVHAYFSCEAGERTTKRMAWKTAAILLTLAVISGVGLYLGQDRLRSLWGKKKKL